MFTGFRNEVKVLSYLTISEMSCDPWLIERIAACAASSRVPDPRAWAASNALYLVSDPAWAEKYREWTPPPAALPAAGEPPAGSTEPGAGEPAAAADYAALQRTAGGDETIITDTMIKTAVEALRAAQAAEHQVSIET